MTRTLIELFPALADCEITAEDPRSALLPAPALLEGDRPVRHAAFCDVSSRLFSAVKGSPLTLLIGASGVGKTRLVLSLVQRVNGVLGRAGRIPAIALVAPTSQRTMFSWKAFWERVLTALEDPLPRAKVDPVGHADALRQRRLDRRRAGRIARTSESRYFEMVCSAAAERDLAVLVIDEATSLARSQHGVTLLDQIAVLRELADMNLFRVVLVSTFEILPHFRRSGVLDRRLSTVVFPRYSEVLSELPEQSSGSATSRSRSIDPQDGGYIAFARSAKTFMTRLPEGSRFTLRDRQFQELYRGSLGCVGVLCDWYLRAAAECIHSGSHRLEWSHFTRTALPVNSRANLIREARRAEEQLALLGDRRLDLTEDELYEIGVAQARADRSAARRLTDRTASSPTSGGKRRLGSRPGIPRPRRRPV